MVTIGKPADMAMTSRCDVLSLVVTMFTLEKNLAMHRNSPDERTGCSPVLLAPVALLLPLLGCVCFMPEFVSEVVCSVWDV